MSPSPRHPIDQLTIRFAKRFLICAAVYSVIIAVFTLLDYAAVTSGLASQLQPIVGMFGTTVMLLCGLGYLMFGRSRRLRIRHPNLIAPHFWLANIALVAGFTLLCLSSAENAKPPTAIRAIPIALSVAAGGIFVVNVWRSLQSKPAGTASETLRQPPA